MQMKRSSQPFLPLSCSAPRYFLMMPTATPNTKGQPSASGLLPAACPAGARAAQTTLGPPGTKEPHLDVFCTNRWWRSMYLFFSASGWAQEPIVLPHISKGLPQPSSETQLRLFLAQLEEGKTTAMQNWLGSHGEPPDL